MTIIWCIILEIWSVTRRILSFWTVFCPFTLPKDPENQNFEKIKKNTWRYYHFTNVHHKWQSYDVWFLNYGVQQTEFFVILDRLLPFCSPNNPNQILKKWKTPRDIIILHMCTINDNHDVWFFRHWVWRTDLFVILDYFLPFYPPNNLKNQNFKKLKNA